MIRHYFLLILSILCLTAQAGYVGPAQIEYPDFTLGAETRVIGKTDKYLYYAMPGNYFLYAGLYRTDGVHVETISGLSQSTIKAIRGGNSLSLDGKFYFIATSGVTGTLYCCDDTSRTAYPIVDSSKRELPTLGGSLVVYHGSAFFLAASNYTGGWYDLWKTNGTSTSTVMVKNISSLTQYAMYPAGESVVAGDLLYFGEFGLNLTQCLWVSDGTASGTHPVASNGTAATQFPSFMQACGDRLCYYTSVDTRNAGLWSIDAASQLPSPVTPLSGSYEIHTLAPGRGVSYSMDYFYSSSVKEGENLYFGDHTAESARLWVTDGTSAGTRVLSSNIPGIISGISLSADGIWFLSSGENDLKRQVWYYDRQTGLTSQIGSLTFSLPYIYDAPNFSHVTDGLAYYMSSDGPVVLDPYGNQKLLRRLSGVSPTAGFLEFNGSLWIGMDRGLWQITLPQTINPSPVTCQVHGAEFSADHHSASLNVEVVNDGESLPIWFEFLEDPATPEANAPLANSRTYSITLTPQNGKQVVSFPLDYYLTWGDHYLVRMCVQTKDQVVYGDPVPFTVSIPEVGCSISAVNPNKARTEVEILGQADAYGEDVTTWLEIRNADAKDDHGQGRLVATTSRQKHGIDSSDEVASIREVLKKLVPGINYTVRLMAESEFSSGQSADVPFNLSPSSSLEPLALDVLCGSRDEWQTIPMDLLDSTYQVSAADSTIQIRASESYFKSNEKFLLFIGGKPLTTKGQSLKIKLKPGTNKIKIISYNSNWKNKRAFFLTITRPKAS